MEKEEFRQRLTLVVIVFLSCVGFLLAGYAQGFKNGSQYTYDSVYLLFTNSVREAANSLDCKANSSELSITKREAPLKCCYPLDCPQAKNNPKVCDCLYTIQCFGNIGYEVN